MRWVGGVKYPQHAPMHEATLACEGGDPAQTTSVAPCPVRMVSCRRFSLQPCEDAMHDTPRIRA